MYISDGTSAGTKLVKDINPGPTGSMYFPNIRMIEFKGKLFFSAFDGSTPTRLWESDGTSEGTKFVNAGSVNPDNLTVVNDMLYFTSFHSSNGTELWKTDGTDAGTTIVYTELFFYLTNLTSFNDNIYFTGSNGVSGNGSELWKSDGSSIGTKLIRDIYPGSIGSQPTNFKATSNALYFRANDGIHNVELWKTNGTSEGTVLVKDINENVNSNQGSSNLDYITPIGDKIYFSATDEIHGYELWEGDGTSEGTKMVADVNPGNNISSI